MPFHGLWRLGSLVVVLFGLVLLLKALQIRSRGSMPEFRARPIMTPTEIGFFELLCASLPEFLVFPQVSMSAIVDTALWRHRGFFSQKTIDFVICRRGDLSVVTVVELDDWSHDGRGHLDARRDAIVGSAGFRTVRIDCRRMPDGQEVRRLVLGVPAP